jgi:hypothetical protein
MLHALVLATAAVLGPEHFVGEPADQPLLVEKRLVTASNGTDLAIVSEGDAITMFRVDPDGPPRRGFRPATGAVIQDVASNGRGYALAWTRGTEFGPNDIGFTVLGDDGKATTTILERRDRRPAGVAIGTNGRNYLVAWDNAGSLQTQLFDANGNALRAIETVRLNTGFGFLTVGSNGSGFVVVAVVAQLVISVRVSEAGVASGPVEVTTQGGAIRAFEWLTTHYLLVTGNFAFGRAHKLDASGRPFGETIPLAVDPQNAVRHGSYVVGESQARLYRVDAEGRMEAMTWVPLPARSFNSVWALASNGIDLFYAGGEQNQAARLLRLGSAQAAAPFGLVFADQHSPQVARAAGVNAVVWREGNDTFASRERGGMRLDGRGVAMPIPPALASDGTRTLMLFAGSSAWPIPLSGPFPIPTGAFAEPPAPTWTGRNFVAVAVTNLGRQTNCLWERRTLHATTFARDGSVLHPRTFLGIDGDVVLQSVVGNGDGFVLAYRYSIFAGCSARYFIQAQTMSHDLQKRADLFPARAVASDGRGTTVFAEDTGVFSGGVAVGKATVGNVHVAWSGASFVLAKQPANGIEVARWDPKTQPLALDWASLDPQVATSDPTATLAGLASSESGAVLVYTRITHVEGYGDWRRVVLREIDASPARRRGTR